MKLLLFDIDMTLLDTGGAGRAAMTKTFIEMFGKTNGLNQVSYSGRTDPLIFREVLACFGIEWAQETQDDFKTRYLQNLQLEIKNPPNRPMIKPGIAAILPQASARSDLTLALLTGNWRAGAHTKLSHFGILDYFEFGAFSDNSDIRSELPPVAARKFKEAKGVEISPADVYVIGDTPLDVACAHPFGAKTVAVATGSFTEGELKKAGPDYLFKDLADTASFFKILDSE